MQPENLQFWVIIEKDEYWYSASCPSLDWCFVQWKTYDEVLGNIKNAINLHIEDRLIMWEEIPHNNLSTFTVLNFPLKVWAPNYQELQLVE